MYKKIISTILVVALLVSPCGTNEIVAGDSVMSVTSDSDDNIYNKLHFYIEEEEYTTIDDAEELTCAIDSMLEEDSKSTTYEVAKEKTSSREINITIEFESDFMQTERYLEISDKRKDVKSSEDVLHYREELNSYSKEYHSSLIEENLDLLEVLDYEEIREIGYSPFVKLKVETSKIKEESLQLLCEYKNIENISIEYEAIAEVEEASWIEALEGINAYDIVSDATYTGDGVRIGVFESGGVCDTSHTNLKGKNITIKDSNEKTTAHATNVVSILATIAPDALFYVSEVGDDVGLDWFITNNCDVINCSFGYFYGKKNESGVYTAGVNTYRYSADAIYDYQIKAHDIIVCKSAGNKNTTNTSVSYNPNAEITSPGYAYNVITVGGVDRNYVNSAYRWIHESGACYVSKTPKVKPNIAAPYSVTVPNVGTIHGTSYATPQVAASIALLVEKDWQYSVYPEWVMSLLTSTAQKTYDYSATIGAFDSKVGAGMPDLEEMLKDNGYRNIGNSSKTSQKERISEQVFFAPGTVVEIGLAWLVEVDLEEEEVYVTDYDLRIYDSSGNLIAGSYLISSNVEKVRVTITKADTYKIVVFQCTAMDDNVSCDWISLTYDY